MIGSIWKARPMKSNRQRLAVVIIIILVPLSSFAEDEFAVRLVHPDSEKIVKLGRSLSSPEGYEQVSLARSTRTQTFWVSKRIELNLDDVALACAEMRSIPPSKYFRNRQECPSGLSAVQEGSPYFLPSIYLALTPRGANKLKNLTEQHIKQLAITFLDQKPIHVAVIFEPITSGVLALFGEFSREEAVQYTRRINDLKMGQR